LKRKRLMANRPCRVCNRFARKLPPHIDNPETFRLAPARNSNLGGRPLLL
jgi:hypothetical protein